MSVPPHTFTYAPSRAIDTPSPSRSEALVLRAPNGGGIHAPEHHSESVEALFALIPGLRVVVPISDLS